MISGSAMEIKAAELMNCQPAPYSPTSVRTITGMGAVLGPAKTRAISRSFQTYMNWKIAIAAIAGVVSGKMMLQKMRTSPAPSMRADSSRSYGMPDMKFRMM
jgi:hypothetical protein